MPAEFKDFLEHINQLKYADKPDYDVNNYFLLCQKVLHT